MRKVLVLVHRWFGLGIALFLFIAGLTGALIAWDHELDALLAPDLHHASGRPSAGPDAALARAEQFEDETPRAHITYLPLSTESEAPLMVWAEAWPNSDGTAAEELPANQYALDPVTGEVLAERKWGAMSWQPEHWMPFLYKLHYSLHLPEVSGVHTGIWLMGFVAIVWFLDAFVALWISFPSWSSWKKSFAFRLRSGSHKAVFDLHRSGGVWLWGLLVILAITAVSMNLREQVVRPIVSSISTLSPSPYDVRQPKPLAEQRPPALSRAEALAKATSEARQRGITAPPGALFHSMSYAAYGVGFFEAGNDHGDGGLGNPWLYFDDTTGAVLGAELPGEGSAGDVFMQLQFSIHSGRLFGVVGRIAITCLGLAIAGLSATGVMLWARKRRARRNVRVGLLGTEAERHAAGQATG